MHVALILVREWMEIKANKGEVPCLTSPSQPKTELDYPAVYNKTATQYGTSPREQGAAVYVSSALSGHRLTMEAFS